MTDSERAALVARSASSPTSVPIRDRMRRPPWRSRFFSSSSPTACSSPSVRRSFCAKARAELKAYMPAGRGTSGVSWRESSAPLFEPGRPSPLYVL